MKLCLSAENGLCAMRAAKKAFGFGAMLLTSAALLVAAARRLCRARYIRADVVR